MKTIEITREELYGIVWSTPISKLSEQYALSNDGIKKICKKFEIPMPDGGYWMKLKFNKIIEISKFNPVFEGVDKIVLTIREEGNLVNVDQSPQTIRTKEILSNTNAPLIVPDELNKPDILILNTKNVHENRKKKDFVQNDKLDTVSIYVEESNYNRALRIMDNFIKLLRYRGHSFRRDRNNWGPRIVVNDVEFHFSIREKNKRIPSTKLYESSKYVPTGILVLKIGESYKAQEWSDGSVKLENQLAKIVAKIELDAQKELEWLEECRIHHIKREEEEKIRNDFAARRNKELQNTKELFNKAEYHNKAKIVKAYLIDLENKANQENNLTNELKEWLTWAADKVSWYDSLINKSDELLNEKDKEEMFKIKETSNNFYRY